MNTIAFGMANKLLQCESFYLVHDYNLVTQNFCFVQEVGGENDCPALLVLFND